MPIWGHNGWIFEIARDEEVLSTLSGHFDVGNMAKHRENSE